jgi:hypothetical protein
VHKSCKKITLSINMIAKKFQKVHGGTQTHIKCEAKGRDELPV